MGVTRNVVLFALLGLALSNPVDNSGAPDQEPAEARSGNIDPSPLDPIRRDGAHHGGGHHGGGHSGGGSFGGASSSYSVSSSGFSGGGFGGSSHGAVVVGHGHAGKGHGSKGSGHHGGGHAGGHHISSNQIVGSSGGYGAPQPQYHEPAKQVGYYYYYYPVTVQDNKKSEKGFFDKMKKLFEPMMYPWNAMMSYFGYGDYDDYDYDYDSYGHYARSFASRASDYVPWEVMNEVGDHVTQDECIEFYMCELGAYAREYRALQYLVDYLLPTSRDNPYYRSFKESIKKEKDCYTNYSCPIIRREFVGDSQDTPVQE